MAGVCRTLLPIVAVYLAVQAARMLATFVLDPVGVHLFNATAIDGAAALIRGISTHSITVTAAGYLTTLVQCVDELLFAVVTYVETSFWGEAIITNYNICVPHINLFLECVYTALSEGLTTLLTWAFWMLGAVAFGREVFNDLAADRML